IAYFNNFGSKQIMLSVSNGFCSDTVIKTIFLGEELKADFETNNLLCPQDTATFINRSSGKITSYFWDFGDGTTSVSQTPLPIHYPILSAEKIYQVKLIVGDSVGC